MIVKKDDGAVSHAIIGVGGFLGIGQEHRVVEFDKLQFRFDAQRDAYVAQLEREALTTAAIYDDDAPPAASPGERRQ